jgi:cell division protein FtsB
MPDGIKSGFLHSNLFIFLLGQAFAFICWLCIFAFGWGQYSERFAEQSKQIGKFESRLDRIEQETSHFDVMEAEHLRLTQDVEKLKDGKK